MFPELNTFLNYSGCIRPIYHKAEYDISKLIWKHNDSFIIDYELILFSTRNRSRQNFVLYYPQNLFGYHLTDVFVIVQFIIGVECLILLFTTSSLKCIQSQQDLRFWLANKTRFILMTTTNIQKCYALIRQQRLLTKQVRIQLSTTWSAKQR